MADTKLSALTAATAGTGGFFYGIQSGNSRKFTLTAAGATLCEAADAAAQRTALSAASLAANTFTATQTISSGGVAFSTNAFLKYDSGNDSVAVRNVADNAYKRLDASVLFGVSIVASNSQVYASGGALLGSPSFLGNGGGMQAVAAGFIGFSSTSSEAGATDVFLRRGGAAILQFGTNHATTGTNQTLQAHGVTTGTGPDLILKGGSGSVANGNVRFGTHTAVGIEVVTGYITIKDEGGTVRKLAVIS